jgi:hypothetical protein
LTLAQIFNPGLQKSYGTGKGISPRSLSWVLQHLIQKIARVMLEDQKWESNAKQYSQESGQSGFILRKAKNLPVGKMQ